MRRGREESGSNTASRQLLRREFFGGLLVSLPEGTITFLDDRGYARQREELSRPAARPRARIVDVTAMGYPLRENALASPGAAYIDVTRRCDRSCSHCYADAGRAWPGVEMTFASLERLLGQLAACGAYYIRLTGGEPTLREDLGDILDAIVDQGMVPSVNTHGLYGEQTLRGLLDRGVTDIRISLDGNEAVNDAIRGTGSYRAVLTTLRRLAEYNESTTRRAEPTINVVLQRSTLGSVGELMELAAGLGFKLSFGLLRPFGRADIREMLSPVEVARAAWTVNRRRQSLGLAPDRVRINYDIFRETQGQKEARPFPFDGSRCPIGTLGLGVAADGRIMPCNYLGSVGDGRWLGEDLTAGRLLDVWHSSVVLQHARCLQRPTCRGCGHHGTTCNGGCPATALAITGHLDGRDPYCVRDVRLSAAGTPALQ